MRARAIAFALAAAFVSASLSEPAGARARLKPCASPLSYIVNVWASRGLSCNLARRVIRCYRVIRDCRTGGGYDDTVGHLAPQYLHHPPGWVCYPEHYSYQALPCWKGASVVIWHLRADTF